MEDKMTPKQAMDEIKHFECETECRVYYEECDNDCCRFKLAIEALEEQIAHEGRPCYDCYDAYYR